MARKRKSVNFDGAAAKTVVSIHFIEYNIVPELFQMYCVVLLQLDSIWSLPNSNIFEFHRMLK